MTAAALAIAGQPDDEPAQAQPRSPGEKPPAHPADRAVTAPVRIADAETVRLLRPGDHVDVVAADDQAAPGDGSGGPHVVASGARVVEVPERSDRAVESGALVVLSVPRSTAARLAGAGATTRLAVTLC